MMRIERETGMTDIRLIMLEAMRDSPTDGDAAARLGITASALSHWIVKLRIEDQAREVRAARSR